MRSMQKTWGLVVVSLVWMCVSTPTASSELRQLRLLFVGDVMGHDSQIASAKIAKDKRYDYRPCFEYVKPLVQQADLAIANLEVTLPGQPPYKGYPRFRSPNALALALRDAGFDILVTANNHSNDTGKKGVVNTIGILKKYGLHHTGTFRNAQERNTHYPLIVSKNDFQLAFLNYTYGTSGIPDQPPTIVNLIKQEQIHKDMDSARALRPDAIIVLMHWGKEYELHENSKQRTLARKLLQWGADMVIGSHPHVVQPIREDRIEVKPGKPKNLLVAYPLGNFISNQSRPNTDGGLMLEVELEKNTATDDVVIASHHYAPVWRYKQKAPTGKVTFRAVPISAFENDPDNILNMTNSDKAAMKRFAATTRSHLARFASSERHVSLQDILGVRKLEAAK